jgi:hypothetical protein
MGDGTEHTTTGELQKKQIWELARVEMGLPAIVCAVRSGARYGIVDG